MIPGLPRPNSRGLIEACPSLPQSSLPSRTLPRPNSRGLIEADLVRRSGQSSVSFHGLTAVASLKRRIGNPRPPRKQTFHGLTAVASLKPRRYRKSGCGRRAFHGLTAVASLKRTEAWPTSTDWSPFHGLTAVASLKRSVSLRAVELGADLPRPNSRGLIEARFSAGVRITQASLPRPNSRGLIEAASSAWASSPIGPFHGLTAVASLKRIHSHD